LFVKFAKFVTINHWLINHWSSRAIEWCACCDCYLHIHHPSIKESNVNDDWSIIASYIE